jgi:hypothetical protein
MAKMAMPKKEDFDVLPMGQQKPALERYWLQVDRQTKSSYPTLEAAQAVGKAIKKSHPKLQVGIFDSEKSQQTLVEA